MLKEKSNVIRFFIILLFIVSISVSISFTNVYGLSNDIEPEFNITNAYVPQGYSLKEISKSRWESADANSRSIYYIYQSTKQPSEYKLFSVKAKHLKGTQTRLYLGVDYLTEEETVRQFGVEVEAKIGAVIGSVGGGFKWGEAKGIGTNSLQTHTVNPDKDDCIVEFYSKVKLIDYYYLVVEEKRDVKKDKGENVTGYYNYRFEVKYDQSFSFEYYDVSTAETDTIFLPC